MIVSFTYNGATYSNWDISKPEIQQQFKAKGINLIPIVQQELQKQLLNLEKQRINKVCDQYGYNGLADVQFYANQTTPDPEAQAILTFYSNANGNGYDDLIWNWITNTLPTYKTLKKLLSLDMKAVEEQIYQQAITNNPLP